MTAPNQILTPHDPTQPAINLSVWIRDTRTLSSRDTEAARQTLSIAEIAQADRLRFPELRRDYIAAHDLLRKALTAHDPRHAPESWAFATGVYGKPTLDIDDKRSGMEFSLTHTAGLVACAVSMAPVGIDVERVSAGWDYKEVARRYFTVAEAESLTVLAPELASARFVELWTLKESFLKAVGCGLSGALDAVSFDAADASRVQYTLHHSFCSRDWQFQLLSPSQDSRLAVAINSSLPMHVNILSF